MLQQIAIEEVHASLILHHLNGLARETKYSLLTFFGTAHAARVAGPDQWLNAALITPHECDDLKKSWAQIARDVEEEIGALEKSNTTVLLSHVGYYPARLREISSPPFLLYAQGHWEKLDDTAVAVVGSRRCSYYGEKVTRQLSGHLAERGIATVSGLARGVDTAAHHASIDAGGHTWAIIGSGLSKLYPPENKKLAERIKSAGVLLSEFPMMTTPLPGNFPRRNRIIAGLAVGTVVIEGDSKSGALITARLAAEEGRDVFAVPGPVTSRLSHAPHRLIKSGAKLVETVDDILEEIPGFERFDRDTPTLEADLSLSEIQRRALQYIGGTSLFREALMQKLDISVPVFNELMLELELRGLIKSGAGGVVSRV